MPLDYFHTAALLGNLLTIPNQFEDQRRQSEVTRMILGQLAQQPGGPQFTPEQMEAYAPTPPPSGLNVPVLGPVLRGVGTIGQVLQGVLGTAPPAPRPPIPELNALAEMQKRNRLQSGRTKVADEIRAGAKPDEIRATALESGVPLTGLGLNQPKSQVYEDWKKLPANLNKGPLEFLHEKALATHVTDPDPDKGAPTFEKDLDREAKKKFPNDETKQFEWKKTQRIESATGRAGALADVKQDANLNKELLANRQVKAQLRDTRDRVAKLLTTNIPELLTQPIGLALERMQGNADAIAAKQLVLFAPQLAKAHGLTARFNQTEFQMYADALDGSKMTAQQYVAAIDNMLHSLDLSENEIKGMMPHRATPTGTTPAPATGPGDSQNWHQMLDQMGVPK